MSNRTIWSRSATARAIAITLAASAGAWLQGASAWAQDPPRGPSLSCSRDICLVVQEASDRDGDGVSDDDEIAAGTDPDDPSSRPHTLELIDLYLKDALPSFQSGMASIVVLPTIAPDGTAILGGLAAMPTRKSTMERLGLTSDLLGGLDLANGLSIGRGAGEPGKGGAPPKRVGGISIGLISAGSDGGTPSGLVNGALNRSPYGSSDIASVTDGPTTSLPGGGSMGHSRVVYDDGSADEVNWQRQGDRTSATVTSYDDTGHASGSTSTTHTEHTDADGTRTSTTSRTSTDAKGNTASSNTTTTTMGDTTTTETNTTTTRTNKDGSTTTRKTGTATTTEGVVLQESVSTTVETTCKGDDCETKTETTGSSTECDASKDSCSGQAGAYVNPDDTTYDPANDLRRMGIVAATTVNTTLAILGGNIKYGDPPVDFSGGPAPSASPARPLVILVDPDQVAYEHGVMLVNGDPRQTKFIAPDYDPNLPNPLADAGSTGDPGCKNCGG
jgi:hypothetical protein